MNWNTFKSKITVRNVGLTLLAGGAIVGLVSAFSAPTRVERIRTSYPGL